MKKELKSKGSHIYFGNNFALEEKLPQLLCKTPSKCALFVDSNIKRIYANELEKIGCKIISFPAGEASKTREMKMQLEDSLLTHNFGRDSLIIGMGGGVVNDLSGFLAATYCRGIPHIQIPTSLLAMVDAAIGGKTGVNTPHGKNMIGSFFPASEVWIDGKFLATLPKEEWTNGIVEMIKAGLIASPSFFHSLRDNHKKWEEKDFSFILEQIFEGVSIKSTIVEKDFAETGLRRILNLGHTFGHALETLENYKMKHGIAVGIGILVSSFISNQMQILSDKDFKEIEQIFSLYQIPLRLGKKYDQDAFLRAMSSDKKSDKGSFRVVLLQSIGKVATFENTYCTEIAFSVLEKAFHWMHEKFYYGQLDHISQYSYREN